MSDIVERLRDYEAIGGTALPKLCGEAADEIERLQGALDTCRELRKLERIARLKYQANTP